MPDDPVTSNPWATNPWQRDSAREAAVDGEVAGGIWGWAVAAATAERNAGADAGVDDGTAEQSSDDVYASLTAEWPPVEPLIERHITANDYYEVFEYWKDHWRRKDKPDDKVWCFDFAQYQLHIAGFRGIGTGSDPTSYFQLFLVRRDDDGARIDETDIGRTAEGVEYLKDRLQRGTPVLLGLRLAWHRKDYNPDSTTNHYVVVVGMGSDAEGGPYGGRYYFTYYDYKFAEPQRFYLYNVPTLALHSFKDDKRHRESGVALRRASQIRYTVRE